MGIRHFSEVFNLWRDIVYGWVIPDEPDLELWVVLEKFFHIPAAVAIRGTVMGMWRTPIEMSSSGSV